MEFEINGMKWTIKQVTQEQMNYDYGKDGYYTHGYTCYSKNEIVINNTTPEPIRTLKHELTHLWLYAYGHCQDDKEFSNEDVCEIVASSNEFINDIVERWRKENVKNKK